MSHEIYDKSVDLIEEGFSLSSTWFNQYVLKTQTRSQIIRGGCPAVLWEMKMRETNTQRLATCKAWSSLGATYPKLSDWFKFLYFMKPSFSIWTSFVRLPNLFLFSTLLTGLKPSLPLNFLELLPTVNCPKVFLDQIVYQFYDHCLLIIRWRRNPNWNASIILVLMSLNKVLRLKKHFRDLLENSLECRRLFIHTAQSLDFQIR